MLEYVFFDQEPMRNFCHYLQEQGLEAELMQAEESFIVAVKEDALDDGLADAIDIYYDDMMDLDQALFDNNREPDTDNYQMAGVIVNLSDNRVVYTNVPHTILKRIMEVLTPQEVDDFVNAIVDAVEHRNDRPLCKRFAEND